MRNSWNGLDSVRSDAVRRAAAEARGAKWFGLYVGACVALVVCYALRTLLGGR